jgi:hypothetical protein
MLISRVLNLFDEFHIRFTFKLKKKKREKTREYFSIQYMFLILSLFFLLFPWFSFSTYKRSEHHV